MRHGLWMATLYFLECLKQCQTFILFESCGRESARTIDSSTTCNQHSIAFSFVFPDKVHALTNMFTGNWSKVFYREIKRGNAWLFHFFCKLQHRTNRSRCEITQI